MRKKLYHTIIALTVILCNNSYTLSNSLLSENIYPFQSKLTGIKNINGKLYAFIVLLYNENPHFVNLIQKDSIPLKTMRDEGFHIKEYKNYLKTINDRELQKLATLLLTVYLEPNKFSEQKLRSIERILMSRNIILKFSKDKNIGKIKTVLDYCIYGKKIPIHIKHPLLTIKEKIYNIQPFIYYEEFSTSNSTFYFDMIYINSNEVENDYIIAKKIINGYDVKSMFFVGSRVTDEIKYCLKKAFNNKNNNIRKSIWEMFVVHELTHKFLNNKLNYYDQVIGEELSLCSTIYVNPFLGLSVLYSYLNYNSINPHRIAAMNFVIYAAERLGNEEIEKNPGLLKDINAVKLKKLSKDYFDSRIVTLN